MADTLSDTMDALVACVCAAFETIDRAACSCGKTIGTPVLGPGQCCNCSDGAGGQVSANLERVFPADGQTLQDTPRFEDCRKGPVAADISIVVARCYPGLDAKGNYPKLDVLDPFADNLNTDMAAAWNALACCGTRLQVIESAVTADPEGGCSAFRILVRTLVKLPPVEAVGS